MTPEPNSTTFDRAQLPPKVLQLLNDLEAFAGLRIPIQRNTALPDRRPLAAAAAFFWPGGAQVEFIEFDERSICHELLHIHRYWVEGVPMLQFADRKNALKDKETSFNCSAEHVVIVRREIVDYGYQEAQKWANDVFRFIWEEAALQGLYRKCASQSPELTRMLFLNEWIPTHFLVTDPEVRAMAEEFLRENGLLSEAKAFTKKLTRVLAWPEEVLATMVRFYGLIPEAFRLAYYDIRNRRMIYKPIPVR